MPGCCSQAGVSVIVAAVWKTESKKDRETLHLPIKLTMGRIVINVNSLRLIENQQYLYTTSGEDYITKNRKA
jgi:hypothetical protein